MTKKDKNEIKVVKINLFSRHSEIVDSFLQNINAEMLEKKNMGLELAFLLFNEKRFQFWISNTDEKRNLFFDGSDTIVYFYSIDEIMEEEYLKFLNQKVKSLRRGFIQKNPLIFVGYGSNLTEKPKNDENLEILRKTFDGVNSLYITDEKSMEKLMIFIGFLNEMS